MYVYEINNALKNIRNFIIIQLIYFYIHKCERRREKAGKWEGEEEYKT